MKTSRYLAIAALLIAGSTLYSLAAKSATSAKDGTDVARAGRAGFNFTLTGPPKKLVINRGPGGYWAVTNLGGDTIFIKGGEDHTLPVHDTVAYYIPNDNALTVSLNNDSGNATGSFEFLSANDVKPFDPSAR